MTLLRYGLIADDYVVSAMSVPPASATFPMYLFMRIYALMYAL
jgi:hypothetical protein